MISACLATCIPLLYLKLQTDFELLYVNKSSYVYRIIRNFGSKKVWRNCITRIIGEKTLAN